jgi:hypothetical protein
VSENGEDRKERESHVETDREREREREREEKRREEKRASGEKNDTANGREKVCSKDQWLNRLFLSLSIEREREGERRAEQ